MGPTEGFDYRNSNANVTCGPACSYSILGMMGVASFLANKYINQEPVAASSRKGPDFDELQAELKEAQEKVADVSEKMEYALKMAEERNKKKKMAYALKILEEKKKRKMKPEKYPGRKRGSNKGILDHIGKGLQYAVKYAQELELSKLKEKKGYGTRKRGYTESGVEKFKRPTSVKMMNPLQYLAHVLSQKSTSRRRYSSYRRSDPYDYSYRKNRYDSSYRTIDYEDYEGVENHLITHGDQIDKDSQVYYSEKEPGYFEGIIDTYKRNKDFIDKENKDGVVEDKQKHVDKNFGLVFDTPSNQPWGEIHQPKDKLELAKYYGKDEYD